MVTTYNSDETSDRVIVGTIQTNPSMFRNILRGFASYDTSSLDDCDKVFYAGLKFYVTTSSLVDVWALRVENDIIGDDLNDPGRKEIFNAFDDVRIDDTKIIDSMRFDLFRVDCDNINFSGNTDFRIAGTSESADTPVVIVNAFASAVNDTFSFRPKLGLLSVDLLPPQDLFVPDEGFVPDQLVVPEPYFNVLLDSRVNGRITAIVDPSDPIIPEQGVPGL